MQLFRILGLIVYGVGIIGGFEGVLDASIPISVVAIIFIVIGSILVNMKDK